MGSLVSSREAPGNPRAPALTGHARALGFAAVSASPLEQPTLEHLELFGISFRSYSHLYWFLGSMTIALTSLAAYAWCRRQRPEVETTRLVWIFHSIALLFHAFACITASMNAYHKAIVLGEDPNGPLFSLDCIWFNALMTLGYLLLIRSLRRAAARWNAAPAPTHDVAG
jgi:hypothetical protein